MKSESNVSNQPIGEIETRQGAINRVLYALNKYKSNNTNKLPDYIIGLEGGVKMDMIEKDNHISNNVMTCFAWIATLRTIDMKWGFGRTGSFAIPPSVEKLVNDGMELGFADDKIFGRVNSGRKDGTVGILTFGAIDRSIFYSQAVVFSLIPFLNDNLYYVYY